MTPFQRHTLLVALVAVACRGTGPGRAGAPPPGALPAPALPAAGAAPTDTVCRVAGGPVQKRDTVTIALAEPVDPAHAPLARNDAERFVFAQLYETLLRVDCAGRVLPGLAASWIGTADRWTFTLREDARFWDGAPVTARDVVAAWRLRDSAFAQSVAIEGDRVLSLRPPTVPVQPLADPALAVTKRAPGGGWPIGTGGHWVSETTGGIVWAVPLRPGAGPALRVVTALGGRLRDAVDAAVDLVLTDDPAVLAYAATRPGYLDLPLGWSTSYALLAPGRGERTVAVGAEGLRDAVHLDARPADGSDGGSVWVRELGPCEPPGDRELVASPGARPRVVYDQADRNAADLAARIVALGALGTRAVAAGLAPGAFAGAVRVGADAAYVFPIRRRVFDVCRATLELPPWSADGSVAPLLDVRSHAVARRGFPALELDWGGTPRVLVR
ncbi:MAG TPA: ABC transporter substrate-binding protein [Gemmatimonadales bacterium]|nr:ABC transporter substrate-binding protein [Gemmatimonadales bacterium]